MQVNENFFCPFYDRFSHPFALRVVRCGSLQEITAHHDQIIQLMGLVMYNNLGRMNSCMKATVTCVK
jgi:hypothetical protein